MPSPVGREPKTTIIGTLHPPFLAGAFLFLNRATRWWGAGLHSARMNVRAGIVG